MNHSRDGQIYLVAVAGSTMSGTAYDLFGLTPPTASRVAVHGG
jgi:hypothetical protein